MKYVVSIFFIFLVLSCSEQNQKQKNNILIEAATTGDTVTVEQLLFDNVNINTRDKCQWTPLMQASANGNIEVVEKLLSQGALFELGDVNSYTPLLLAVINNHTDIINLLIEYGADINHQELGSGETSLIIAVKNNRIDIVKILLQYRAKQSIKDKKGRTAHDWAIVPAQQNIAQQKIILLLESDL